MKLSFGVIYVQGYLSWV